MVPATQAVYEIVSARLIGANPLWGGRVEPVEMASANMVRPYVQFFEASGGRDLVTPQTESALILLSVKGVASQLADAFAMRQAIIELLDDSGEQDINPRLSAHADWRFLTVTGDRHIFVQEVAKTGETIYHAGAQFEFRLSAR